MGIFVDIDEVLASYSFGLARDPAQRLQALRLRQAVYARKGILENTGPSDLYVPSQAFVPGSAMFVAARNNEIVGTVSLYADSKLGLPMDEVHPSEVQIMRRRTPRLAEIGGLAISEEVRKSRLILLLFYAVFQWCRRCQFDGAVICVHPSSKRVYSSLLHFEILGPQIAHPRFRQAPSLPLGIEFRTAADEFRRTYGHDSAKMDLFSFFNDAELPLDLPQIVHSVNSNEGRP